ncbi:MAG: substrate-binding domain-containing protein [Lentisphaeria bacterium]
MALDTFKKIVNVIEKNIVAGNYDPFLPSIAKLSEKFKVCPATIKRSLSVLRERDLAVGIKGRAVVVNQKAIKNPFFHKNIVFLTSLEIVANPFYSKVLNLLNKELLADFFRFFLYVSPESFSECGFVPDVVVVINYYDAKTWRKILHFCPKEKIIALNYMAGNFCNVFTDNVSAGYEAMRFLAEKNNHREIGVITTQMEFSYGVYYLRCEGIKKYSNEHPETAIWLEEVETNKDVPEAVDKLKKNHPEITAIFALSDYLTIGVYSYAYQHDLRIPEDLSVISFDNQRFTQSLMPPITTFEENAEESAELLLKKIKNIILDGKKVEKSVAIKPLFIERKSVQNRGPVSSL